MTLNHIVVLVILIRYAIGNVERNGSIGWLHTLGDQLGKHFNDSVPGKHQDNNIGKLPVRCTVRCIG